MGKLVNALCVGGGSDGRIISVDSARHRYGFHDPVPADTAKWYDVVASTAEAPRISSYRQERLEVGSRVFFLLVHEGMSTDKAVERVLQHYSDCR